MKIILSRKGIDGGNCKASNLVMCDNQGNSEMIMIPIPSPSDKISYKDIKLSKNYDFYVKNHLKNHGIDLASYCHLDPYLINYFPDTNILGSFGQVGIAQGHLEKQKVQAGDLFVFFGKFDIQKISVRNVETVMKNQHILFGYLQINEIIYPNRLTDQEINDYEKKYPWLSAHPHWNKAKYEKHKNNCIYIAKDRCSFDENIQGYGVFEFNKDLILTKENRPSSQWELPKQLRHLKMSYHNDSSQTPTCFQSAKRGQEFVIEENKNAEEWAMSLIKNHLCKRR